MKAAVRDVKAFRDANLFRPIPVGYKHWSYLNDPSRPGFEQIADWLVCGGSLADTIDFLAVYGNNNFCPAAVPSLDECGYTNATNILKDIAVPIFLSGDGCAQRDNWPSFWSLQLVFQTPMIDLWSGSIVQGWWNQ